MELHERTEEALARFKTMSCSKAVLSSYCDLVELSEARALALALGFRGGLFKRQTCGAVTAMMMVAGLAGSSEELCRKLMNRFEDEMGSTMCRHFVELHDGYGFCPELVRQASRLLNEEVFVETERG